MEGGAPTQASTPRGAVFLSYASQDAEAAQRICEALRATGIEVWFDQSALRGGDVWDQTIRRQMELCAAADYLAALPATGSGGAEEHADEDRGNAAPLQ